MQGTLALCRLKEAVAFAADTFCQPPGFMEDKNVCQSQPRAGTSMSFYKGSCRIKRHGNGWSLCRNLSAEHHGLMWCPVLPCHPQGSPEPRDRQSEAQEQRAACLLSSGALISQK